MGNDLERLCKRYEIAVGNFGRSCAAMRANEKCFQAWYASCVIQEFGLSRVYREVHLSKGSLFTLIPPHPLWKALNHGNELFPDLVVSWEPDIDARHSRSRPDKWREADAMLSQIAIVSELKVTGSTGISTGIHQFRQDLAKLAVFAAACPMKNGERKIASYMVVLDNHCDDCGEPTAKYEKQAIKNILKDRAQEWPADVPLPVVMLIAMNGQDTTVTRFTEQPRGSAVMGRRLIWDDIAKQFPTTQRDWRLESRPRSSELRLVSRSPGITYLWEYDKERQLWADVRIDGPDKLRNGAMVQQLKASEANVRKGIAAKFELEPFRKSGATAGFCVQQNNGDPSAEDAVKLMMALIDRTWPLLSGLPAKTAERANIVMARHGTGGF